MKNFRIQPRLIACLILFVFSMTSIFGYAATVKMNPDELAEKEAFSIGYQSYLWGFVYVKSMLLKEEAINPDYRAYTPINSIKVEDHAGNRLRAQYVGLCW